MHRFALSQQILLFLLAGIAQVALDSAVFIAGTALGLPVIAGNVAGRVSGACLGYWLHGRYTFARRERHALGGGTAARFLLAWSLLTVLSTALLYAVAQLASLPWAWLAKPAVEALMAVVGFLAWRHWVYR